ncbi:deleted in malignant brain tumors 1 protein-like [Physella acuta]|uniref:deleted in malignant brain tumors 1 protein-like n=1 Tax=Physella acuta TaxID=109671 RepID=UPI0027DD0168|nr:deleted in malignant brain tumors 1 protein-like [Physella acuta]
MTTVGWTTHHAQAKMGFICQKSFDSKQYRSCTLYGSGKLASPGYPFRYLNNQKYTWTLSTRAKANIILNISFVETESCHRDYITVYDGATENDRSFRKVCDRGDSAVMVSTTNILLVTFKTDSSGTYRGFYGEFYSQAEATV